MSAAPEVQIRTSGGEWVASPWPRTRQVEPRIRVEALAYRSRRVCPLGILVWESDLQRYQWEQTYHVLTAPLFDAVVQLGALLTAPEDAPEDATEAHEP
jgi:hypothetical protein